MPRVFIGFGSNIDPEVNISKALRLLGSRVCIKAISTVYLTEPEGGQKQDNYYNGVVEVETEIPPRELKINILRKIEAELGRVREVDKYAPRSIDLDLLVYDAIVIDAENLQLPDPLITKRAFLSIPLAELAPDMKFPGSDKTFRELAKIHANHNMKPLFEYTQLLRDAELS